MIGILQDPHFEYALARVKIRHRSEDIEENCLNDFLSFAWVPNDSECHAECKMLIPVKENCHGVMAARRHILRELFVRELTKVFGFKSESLGEGHFRATSTFRREPNRRATISCLYNTNESSRSGIYFSLGVAKINAFEGKL